MIGTVSISKNAYAAIMFELKKAYPHEGCGVLLGSTQSGIIDSIGSMDNAAGEEEKASRYKIDPLLLYGLEAEAEENDRTVAGFYHSHPDKAPVLSKEDIRYMIPGMLYMIVSTFSYGTGEIKGYMRDEPDGKVYGVSIRET